MKTINDRDLSPQHLPVCDQRGNPQHCRICRKPITTERPWLTNFAGFYHADCFETARTGKHLRVIREELG